MTAATQAATLAETLDPGELHSPVATQLDELNALGTPDAIAERMRELGRRGRCGQSGQCVIANHLRAEVTDLALVSVSSLGWSVSSPDYVLIGHGDTPPAVAAFIDRFDRRYYPDLIGSACSPTR